MLSALVSAIHLLCLGGGVACIFLRADALTRQLDDAGLKRLFTIDNSYGVLSMLWLGSGAWRAFGSLEKGGDYYLHNHFFLLKMAGLFVLMAVEMPCMVTFIRWRIRQQKGQSIDTSSAPRLRRLHWIELGGVLLIVVAASAMARGIGTPSRRPSGAAESAAFALGESVYATHCSPCHGPDGSGRSGTLAANFVGDKTRLAKPDELLLQSISSGVPDTAMIGFSGRLSVEQQRAVLAYIRAQFGQ